MRLFISVGFVLVSVVAWGQSRTKLYFSASLNPVITMAYNTTSSNKPASSNTSQTLTQYQDSIRSFETYKLSAGATVWVNYLINAKWGIQTGIGYSEVGFSRQQNDIQFNDKLFPGIGSGKVIDISLSERSANYRLRYQYISVPVLFNYYAKRSGDFKWTYYFTGGLGLNVLVNHEMKALLDQFVIDGEDEFHIDSTGYEGSAFALNLFVGGRIDYKVDKSITVFAQPMVTAFPLSVSKSDIQSYPIGLQVNLGVAYVLDKKKDEKKSK